MFQRKDSTTPMGSLGHSIGNGSEDSNDVDMRDAHTEALGKYGHSDVLATGSTFGKSSNDWLPGEDTPRPSEDSYSMESSKLAEMSSSQRNVLLKSYIDKRDQAKKQYEESLKEAERHLERKIQEVVTNNSLKKERSAEREKLQQQYETLKQQTATLEEQIRNLSDEQPSEDKHNATDESKLVTKDINLQLQITDIYKTIVATNLTLLLFNAFRTFHNCSVEFLQNDQNSLSESTQQKSSSGWGYSLKSNANTQAIPPISNPNCLVSAYNSTALAAPILICTSIAVGYAIKSFYFDESKQSATEKQR